MVAIELEITESLKKGMLKVITCDSMVDVKVHRPWMEQLTLQPPTTICLHCNILRR